MGQPIQSAYDYLKPRRSALYLFLVLYLLLLTLVFFIVYETNILRMSMNPYLYAAILVGSAILSYEVASPVTRYVSIRHSGNENYSAGVRAISRILFRPSNLQMLFVAYIVGSFVAFVYLHFAVVRFDSSYMLVGGYFLFTFPASVAYLILAGVARLLRISSYRADFFFIMIPLSLPITVAWFFIVASGLERVALRCRASLRRLV
jgi:hypothetical protein